MARLSRRGPWLPEEDNALVELVRTQGPNNWVRISQQLQYRSPKQCRERYHQNLKPSLNHEPITVHEGEVIEQLVNEMGKRWAEIARRLGNRSDNAVKNWWNGSMNRRKRNPSQQHNTSRIIGPRRMLATAEHHKSIPDAPRQIPLTELVDHSLRQPTSSPRLGDQRHFLPIPQVQAEHPRDVQAPQAGTPAAMRLPSLRLPPLRFSSADNMQGVTVERPSVSPAASEFGYGLYGRQAPSLISDAQSTHSISPKTVASPRLSAPLSWYSERPSSGDYHGIPGQSALSPLDTTTIRLPEIVQKQTVYSYPEPLSMHLNRCSSYRDIPPFSNEVPRDTRIMHVSSLVQ